MKEDKSTVRAVTSTVLGSQTFLQSTLQSDKPGQREVFLAASESQQSAELLFLCGCYDKKFFEDLKIERSKEYQRIQKIYNISVEQPEHVVGTNSETE